MDLSLLLSDDHRLIWEAAQSFAQKAVAPGAAERDHRGHFPEDLVTALGEMGFLGMKVPTEAGGSGSDMTSYALVLTAISRACASTAVTCAVANLAADVLSKFGNAEQKSILTEYLTGKIGPGSFCLSEPQAGSDAAGLKTTARRDGDDYIIDGAKQWISNGAYAPFHIVFARTDPDAGSKGMSAFFVPRGAKGLVIGPAEKKMGLKSSNTVPLMFEGCRVPKTSLIGAPGDGYRIALSGLDGGRIGIAAQAVGISQAAIDEGVQYAQERKAFGKDIASFQNSQFAIADSETEMTQSWLLMLQAARKNTLTGKSAKESSMAKVWASEACCRIVDRMLQLHGGYGYVQEYPIERLYRDARVTRIYEGTSEVQRIVISREVLRGHG